MTWNYRVMQHETQGGEIWFSIREVYYREADLPPEPSNVEGWTKDPCDPYGETLEALAFDLDLMAKALDLPVLVEKELPQYATK